MFSGIVEALGTVYEVVHRPPGIRLIVQSDLVAEDASVGDSIAVSGCCLTVVEIDGDRLSFDAGEETLSRTNLGALTDGGHVNLERSLQVGARISGHFVFGHVDAVGHVDDRQDDEEWSKFWFRMPQRLGAQMISKGSIAVDGVSLTLVDVEAARFSVALIPHTLSVTTLGGRKVGDAVNLETDMLAKYVEKQLATHGAQ